MGIQDRDYYWEGRSIDGARSPSSSDQTGGRSVPPPGMVYSSGKSDDVPNRNFIWTFLTRPWVTPFFLGIAVGKSWGSLKELGQLIYDKSIGTLF